MKKPTPKIKPLIIIRGLDIGGFHGGAERFGIELAKALDPQEYQTSICAFFRHRTESEAFWEQNLKQANIDYFFASDWTSEKNLFDYISGIMKLNKRFSKNHFDICHSHFYFGTIAAIYLKVRHPRLSIVNTSHLDLDWGNSLFFRFRKWIFSYWIFPLFVNIEIGVSKAITVSLSKTPGAMILHKRPRNIPNAITIKSIPHEDGRFNNSMPPSDVYKIGWVGRMSVQKGLVFLLKSMKLILQSNPSAELYLVGEGEQRPSLEAMVNELGITSKVHFLGRIHDVSTIFSKLDLFVLPSLWEGLPTVILESMYYGVPVVATNIPGPSELIQNGYNGWLVPPQNPEELARTIILALNDVGLREQTRLKGFETCKHFAIDRIAAQYEELFNQLVIAKSWV